MPEPVTGGELSQEQAIVLQVTRGQIAAPA
jgi:hypothetical protein